MSNNRGSEANHDVVGSYENLLEEFTVYEE